MIYFISNRKRTCKAVASANETRLLGTPSSKNALPTIFPECTSQPPTKRRRYLTVGQTSSAPLTIELGTAHAILSTSNVQDQNKKLHILKWACCVL